MKTIGTTLMSLENIKSYDDLVQLAARSSPQHLGDTRVEIVMDCVSAGWDGTSESGFCPNHQEMAEEMTNTRPSKALESVSLVLIVTSLFSGLLLRDILNSVLVTSVFGMILLIFHMLHWGVLHEKLIRSVWDDHVIDRVIPKNESTPSFVTTYIQSQLVRIKEELVGEPSKLQQASGGAHQGGTDEGWGRIVTS
jgi:hypothetical protein